MSLQSGALIDALVSHAMTTGYFERVNAHEPKNAPGYGLTAAVWNQTGGPVQSSGLAQTSAVVTFYVRLFTSMVSEPQDMIDPNLLDALDALLTAYSGDFTLDGMIRQIDLLGAESPGLSWVAGYIDVSGTKYRCMTITVPLVVNDVWEQVP
jgi:hypothetical protein